VKHGLQKFLVKWLSLRIFLLCAFSCTQKNPPKQDSQTDNLKSNVLDSAERFMSGFFLDEKMRITRLASANFQEAFVFETPSTANSKNSDQVWRSIWMEDKSLGANTKCSGWFDAFLSGDQETFTPSDEKGEKYILQYRICTGPHNPNATTTGPIGWVRSLASYCAAKATFQNTKPYDWTVYRTVNVKYHASMNLRREQSLCTAWKPKLFYLNLLGKAVNYSHTRVCSRVCDPMESDCKTNTVNFAEYAEYPTAEYLDSMRAQSGNKGCN
jgi:hypothetical protein